MLTASATRAARALIGWSQEDLARCANVGVGTVRNFEIERTMPSRSTMHALRSALEAAGVEFIDAEEGGPGVLARRFRLRGYVPGDGLNLVATLRDLSLDEPDNDFDQWFRLTDAALAELAGRAVNDEADARAVVAHRRAAVIRALKLVLARDMAGSGPRLVGRQDVAGSPTASAGARNAAFRAIAERLRAETEGRDIAPAETLLDELRRER